MTRSAREARPERAVETIAEAVAARRNARLGAQLQPVELVVEDDVHDAGNGAGPPCGGRAARHQFDPLDKVRRHEIERSEEHTSELQSLMRNSYAVFCLQKKKHTQKEQQTAVRIPHQNRTTRSRPTRREYSTHVQLGQSEQERPPLCITTRTLIATHSRVQSPQSRRHSEMCNSLN